MKQFIEKSYNLYRLDSIYYISNLIFIGGIMKLYKYIILPLLLIGSTFSLFGNPDSDKVKSTLFGRIKGRIENSRLFNLSNKLLFRIPTGALITACYGAFLYGACKCVKLISEEQDRKIENHKRKLNQIIAKQREQAILEIKQQEQAILEEAKRLEQAAIKTRQIQQTIFEETKRQEQTILEAKRREKAREQMQIAAAKNEQESYIYQARQAISNFFFNKK